MIRKEKELNFASFSSLNDSLPNIRKNNRFRNDKNLSKHKPHFPNVPSSTKKLETLTQPSIRIPKSQNIDYQNKSLIIHIESQIKNYIDQLVNSNPQTTQNNTLNNTQKCNTPIESIPEKNEGFCINAPKADPYQCFGRENSHIICNDGLAERRNRSPAVLSSPYLPNFKGENGNEISEKDFGILRDLKKFKNEVIGSAFEKQLLEFNQNVETTPLPKIPVYSEKYSLPYSPSSETQKVHVKNIVFPKSKDGRKRKKKNNKLSYDEECSKRSPSTLRDSKPKVPITLELNLGNSNCNCNGKNSLPVSNYLSFTPINEVTQSKECAEEFHQKEENPPKTSNDKYQRRKILPLQDSSRSRTPLMLPFPKRNISHPIFRKYHEKLCQNKTLENQKKGLKINKHSASPYNENEKGSEFDSKVPASTSNTPDQTQNLQGKISTTIQSVQNNQIDSIKHDSFNALSMGLLDSSSIEKSGNRSPKNERTPTIINIEGIKKMKSIPSDHNTPPFCSVPQTIKGTSSPINEDDFQNQNYQDFDPRGRDSKNTLNSTFFGNESVYSDHVFPLGPNGIGSGIQVLMNKENGRKMTGEFRNESRKGFQSPTTIMNLPKQQIELEMLLAENKRCVQPIQVSLNYSFEKDAKQQKRIKIKEKKEEEYKNRKNPIMKGAMKSYMYRSSSLKYKLYSKNNTSSQQDNNQHPIFKNERIKNIKEKTKETNPITIIQKLLQNKNQKSSNENSFQEREHQLRKLNQIEEEMKKAFTRGEENKNLFKKIFGSKNQLKNQIYLKKLSQLRPEEGEIQKTLIKKYKNRLNDASFQLSPDVSPKSKASSKVCLNNKHDTFTQITMKSTEHLDFQEQTYLQNNDSKIVCMMVNQSNEAGGCPSFLQYSKIDLGSLENSGEYLEKEDDYKSILKKIHSQPKSKNIKSFEKGVVKNEKRVSIFSKKKNPKKSIRPAEYVSRPIEEGTEVVHRRNTSVNSSQLSLNKQNNFKNMKKRLKKNDSSFLDKSNAQNNSGELLNCNGTYFPMSKHRSYSSIKNKKNGSLLDFDEEPQRVINKSLKKNENQKTRLQELIMRNNSKDIENRDSRKYAILIPIEEADNHENSYPQQINSSTKQISLNKKFKRKRRITNKQITFEGEEKKNDNTISQNVIPAQRHPFSLNKKNHLDVNIAIVSRQNIPDSHQNPISLTSTINNSSICKSSKNGSPILGSINLKKNLLNSRQNSNSVQY